MAVLNPSTQSYIDYLLAQRAAMRDLIATYRDYAAGEHALQLTDEQVELLMGEDGASPEFHLNVCETILDVEVNRLEVAGIQVTVPRGMGVAEPDALGDALTKLAWRLWKGSRMDEGQQITYYAAARDGTAYQVLYWDEAQRIPRMAFNQAYDGTDSGIEMVYEDDDPARPVAAVKVWKVRDPNSSSDAVVRRKNIYYPDRIEKWICDDALTGVYLDAGWRPLRYGDPDWDETLVEMPPVYPYSANETATVAWWTDTGRQGGQPLGIPVIPFRRGARGGANGRSAIADVAPGLQDAINLAGVSLMAATLLSGFKIIVISGLDDSNTTLKLYPGAAIRLQDPAAGATQLGETDLRQLMEVKNGLIRDAAMLTATPLSFFNLSGDIPAEGTQKQLEAGLISKAKRSQISHGNAIEDAVRMMFKIASVQGERVGLTLAQIDELEISCKWEPVEVRNELEQTEIAERHEKLGVPRRFLWQRLGYTPEEIEAFEEEADTKRNQAMGQLVGAIQQAEAEQGQQQEQQTPQSVGASGGNNGTADTG